MALHRLKPLLGAFERIDAAIEAAADAGSCRDEFRRARARIVEMLCAAADDGDKAEGLCALLDEALAGSLATLLAVPAEKTDLSSGGLVGAVDVLMREHPSERVRGLAADVVRGWRAGVKADIARAMAKLDCLPSTPPPLPHHDMASAAGCDAKANKIPEQLPRPRKTTVVSNGPLSKTSSDPIVSSSHAKPSAPAADPAQQKKATAVVVSSIRRVSTKSAPTVATTRNAKPPVVPVQLKKTPPVIRSSIAEEKLEATKRKLHERYQEAEDAKRLRTIQVIKPPQPPPVMTGQRQRIAHPSVRARGLASCAAERIFNKSCSLRMKV